MAKHEHSDATRSLVAAAPKGSDRQKELENHASYLDEISASVAKNRKNYEVGYKEMAPPSALSKAREHLDKEVQRGKHSPKVGGHKVLEHGGRFKDREYEGRGTIDNMPAWHPVGKWHKE